MVALSRKQMLVFLLIQQGITPGHAADLALQVLPAILTGRTRP